LGDRGPLSGQVQVIGRHQLGVPPVAVQGRPPSVRTLGGVLDKEVGVVLRVAGPAQAMLVGHRDQDPNRPVAVGPVVLAADPDAVAFQVVDRHLEGVGPALGHLPPDLGAGAGGQ
jgi:hypothetical protein